VRVAVCGEDFHLYKPERPDQVSSRGCFSAAQSHPQQILAIGQYG